jgi:flagellar biosynthetic protein FliP
VTTASAQQGALPARANQATQFDLNRSRTAQRPAEPAPESQAAQTNPFSLNEALSPQGLTPTLKVMILLTLLSLAPSLLVMTTSFIRFVIVFGLLRQALGTQQLPPTQVITSLSLFLTMFVMLPVWQQAYDEGIEPYVKNEPIPNLQPGEDPLTRVFHNTMQPIRYYMGEQIHKAQGDDVVYMLIDFRQPSRNADGSAAVEDPATFDEVDTATIVTAYMLSELKTAFVIGFQIYLPFVVIDMVVSTILTGMGMVMLPPTLISLPFKLLLFVLIDGWTLTVQMLLQSVYTASG